MGVVVKIMIAMFVFGLSIISQIQAQFIDSVLISKTLFKDCDLFSSYQINIEDFLRFDDSVAYQHGSSDLAIVNLVWTNESFSVTESSGMLQVKVSSPVVEGERPLPLNVCIVVDRSASMSENRRMEKVKFAMKEFFKMLQPNDYASIVMYDDNASVLLPAQKMMFNHYDYIARMVDSIKLGGSTNMFAGMILGYKEVLKHYDPTYCNRVILLTDGITNRGVTDPENIITQSKGYNRQGIEISTIGVGSDINFALLSDIAREGHGLSHYIGDCDSVQNEVLWVFKEEMQNMQALIKNPVLEISYPKQFTTRSISNINSVFKKCQIDIPIENVYQGMSQVSMVNFFLNGRKPPKNAEIKVQLKYFDVLLQQDVKKTVTKKLNYLKDVVPNSLKDEREIKGNYYIALMASVLRQSVQELENKRYTHAHQTLSKCLRDVEDKVDLSNPNGRQCIVYQILQYQQSRLDKLLKSKRIMP